jgi:hypothetical protein
VLERGHRGWIFIGNELDVRHKESSIHIHLILIPLTEDSCLIQIGETLVQFQFEIRFGVESGRVTARAQSHSSGLLR